MRTDNGQPKPSFEIRLVEARKDPIAAIRLKISVDKLIIFVKVGHAARLVHVVVVDIHNRDPIPALLQILHRQHQLASLPLGHHFLGIDLQLLNHTALEIDCD